MRDCACGRKIGNGAASSARRCSADIPVCGFTELSSSVSGVIARNWGLESPQNPQTGMSALRVRAAPKNARRIFSMGCMGCGIEHRLGDGLVCWLGARGQLANDDIKHRREHEAEESYT